MTMIEKTGSNLHHQDRQKEARRLGAQGVALAEAKKMDESYRCFEQAYEIAKEIDDPGLQSDTLGSMGMLFLEIGDPAQALEKVNAALLLAQGTADQRREMAQLGSLGNIYLTIAAGEDAQRFFSRAYDLALSLDDKQSQAGYLGNLATLKNAAGQPDQAAQLFERTRTLAREVGDALGERNALRHLIALYSDSTTQQDLLLSYLQRAVDLSRQLDDYPGQAAYQDALILALLGLNRRQEALALIDEALEDEQLSTLPERELHLLVNRGNAYFDSNLLPEAAQTYEQALRYAVRRQNWPVETRMLSRLGAVAAESGDMETAVAYAHKALAKAERVQDKPLLAEQQCMLALAYRDTSQRTEAIAHAQQAVDTLSDETDHPLQERALRLLEELRQGSDG